MTTDPNTVAAVLNVIPNVVWRRGRATFARGRLPADNSIPEEAPDFLAAELGAFFAIRA